MSREPFEYAILRVVPRIERGEQVNVGVLLYCRNLDYLGVRVYLDELRLRALDPAVDVDAVRCVLERIAASCDDTADSARYAGPGGVEDRGRRFRRLTAPRSTIVQAGPVHTGLTTEPATDLQRLHERLVLPVRG